MAEPLSSTFTSSSLVRDVDTVSRPGDVQRQTISPPPQPQQQQMPIGQSEYRVPASSSTLPMPDVVLESFVDDLPASVSPATDTSFHPALLVILYYVHRRTRWRWEGAEGCRRPEPGKAFFSDYR